MYEANVNGHFEFEIGKKGENLQINGEDVQWDLTEIKEVRFSIILNGKNYDAEIISHDPKSKTLVVRVNNGTYTVRLKDQYDRLLEQMGFGSSQGRKMKELKAPMPGLVLDIKVQEGSEVKKGDSLLVLEAMKMENVLKAEADATVKSIRVKGGDAVEKNELLLEFE